MKIRLVLVFLITGFTVFFLKTAPPVVNAEVVDLNANVSIAVMPYDKFDRRLTVTVIQGIILLYRKVNIVVLPSKVIPEEAFYKERKRYRAEKLLDHLESVLDTSRYVKVIGLTDKEISTTKGEYYDVSILGLAREGGRSCVVSTARLGKNRVSKSHFLKRLTKVVNQQLGRTFGLETCDKMKCLMRSSHDKAKILDELPGQLCPECRKYTKRYFDSLLITKK